MFWPIAAIAVLLGAELWGAKSIRNHVPAPYGDTIVHLIAVTLIVVVFLLIDALIRRFYWHGYVRRRTGRDRAVVSFMERDASTREFMDRLEAYLRYVVPYYIAEGKSYLTIAVGCTGGRHRSVMIAERLRRALISIDGARVRVRHRDVGHA